MTISFTAATLRALADHLDRVTAMGDRGGITIDDHDIIVPLPDRGAKAIVRAVRLRDVDGGAHVLQVTSAPGDTRAPRVTVAGEGAPALSRLAQRTGLSGAGREPGPEDGGPR